MKISLKFIVKISPLIIMLRYVAVEGMCTMYVDLNPVYWDQNKLRRPLFVAFSCLVCFFAALPMVTKGGMYVFQVSLKLLYRNFLNFAEIQSAKIQI